MKFQCVNDKKILLIEETLGTKGTLSSSASFDLMLASHILDDKHSKYTLRNTTVSRVMSHQRLFQSGNPCRMKQTTYPKQNYDVTTTTHHTLKKTLPNKIPQ